MAHRYLADAVLLLHLAFILFVVAGALLVLRRRRWMPLHLAAAAAAWGVGIELSAGVCPLTRVELWLRRLAGGSGYAGGFVEHYLVALIYPVGLGPDVQYLLASCVVAVNVGLYAWLLARRPSRT